MKKFFPIIVLFGCVAVFAFGVVELFELRFEHGDVYPPYSSLRADPLGAMAFYESLEKIPGVGVSRDFSANNQLPDAPQTVYLHLAGEPREFEWLAPDLFQEIKDFLIRGNRLVITFFPQTESYRFYYRDGETNSINSSETNSAKMTPPKPLKDRKKISGDDEQWISLEEEWDFHAGFKKLLPDGDSYAPVRVFNRTDLPLPRALDWHSGMIFTNCGSAWKTVYARGTNAVVIERKFGKGSVVLATDSYFISNEAMEKDRHPELLAWLIGGNKNIVFDEAHLGIVETGGVATLMRKYRLHALVGALILLGGLFIWKNSTSLVPPHAEERREGFVAGKDAQAGFVNLLRRSLAPRDLLAICFAEWKKTVAPVGKIPPKRIQEAETVFNSENALPQKSRDPIGAYRKISEKLGTLNRKL
ncbi:MAG TPA: DUF4350 domain-containing protein [Verrucomicrobiae bacterium]|nr:DUF4350 domain-containing protein [Verrucomicrobiae bacterium]